ncbi:MAG TPA: MFS transporter [Propionibacterium sp.]|nr:MFS transporter [Propionibacterium sp.]
MDFTAYAEIWRLPRVRQAVLLGALGKAPWFGAGVVLTLHVVGALGQSYASAGLVTAVFTVSIALASPLRGRLLDTIGLRRTLLPSLVLLPVAFVAAPFLGYWPLLVVMGGVGLLAIPWFVLTRQLILAAVPESQRRAGLALDSVVTEMAFIAGPTVGILLAASWHTGWTLTLLALASVAAAWGLFVLNPALVTESDPASGSTDAPGDAPREAAPARGGVRSWLNGPVVATFVATMAASFTLAGTDLTMVAAARTLENASALAILIIFWGAGSLIGGLLFGTLPRRSVGLRHLLLGLATTTMLAALGTHVWVLAGLLWVAGLFCAPTLAATSERLGDLVPAASRGEAFGWSGTMATAGNALAPPLVGFVLDTWGWHWGFVATGVAGLALAVVGWVALQAGRRGLSRARSRQARAGSLPL